MKKRIVIISYYFTSTTITAVNRSLSWFRFFPKYDIYPIVLTRGVKGDYGVEKTKNGEIHKIKATELYSKRISNKKFPSIIKLLYSKLYSITIGISKFDKTYKDFNVYFTKFLSKECDLIIITGGPFILFRIGYNFTKNTKKKWIADYRDLWNLAYINKSKKKWFNSIFNNSFALKVEKRWINTAYKISTTTNYFMPILKKISKVPIFTIENGFFHEEFKELNSKVFGKLTFVYIGSIYKDQKIELSIKAINEACKLENYQSQLLFVGSQFHKELNEFINKWESNNLTIKIIPRIPKKEVLKLQNKCHLGLMCGYGVKGIPSSKLYDFLGMKQPVLLYPSDNDIIEKRLIESGLGFSYNTYPEAIIGIRKIIKEFVVNNAIFTVTNEKYINKYSREKLADLYYTLMLKDL